MTVYFSLCTLCCMRAIPIFACLALLCGPSVAAETPPVEALLHSEFLFQAGRFDEAFGYYRGRSPVTMSEAERRRGRELAIAVGDTDWLRGLPPEPEADAQADMPEPERLAWQGLLDACADPDAEACRSRLAALDPADFGERYRRSAFDIARRSGDAAQELRWLKTLPQDGGSYYLRIVLLSKAMDDAQAKALMGEIADDSGLNPFQRAVLQGSLSELRRDWAGAERFYREALIEPVPSMTALRLAVVLLRQDRRGDAFAQLHAVQEDVRYSDELRREAFLTEIQFRRILDIPFEQGRTTEAIYRRALSIWPQAHGLRYRLAMHLFARGRSPAAMAELEALLVQAPGHFEALNAYGYTLAKELDRPRVALAPVERAYRLAPERAEILDSYGYVLHRLGRNRDALPSLEKAWRLTPSAVTAAHLALVHLQLGDAGQARSYLQQGLQLDADEPELLAVRERLP